MEGKVVWKHFKMFRAPRLFSLVRLLRITGNSNAVKTGQILLYERLTHIPSAYFIFDFRIVISLDCFGTTQYHLKKIKF